MSAHEVLTRDDDIDVIGLFAALKRKWWLIVLVTIIAAVGLFMSLSAVSPRYQSEARIAILNNESSFTRSTRDSGQRINNERLGEQAVLTQVEIISSDKAALRIVDDLELMKLKEFGGKGFFDRLIDGLLGKDPDNFDLEATTDESEKRDIMKRRDSALSKFKDKLDVYAVEKTTIIVIEFWSHDPDLAQKIVKGLSENYIARQVDSKNQENLEAAGWLDPKIEEFEERIRLAETAVANFRADSDIFASNTASGENNGNGLLATQQLSEVSTELSRLKAARSSAQAKVASIRAALDSGASLDVIPEVIDSRLIQNLREREATLRAQISDLNTTLLPNHPRMQALNSQLDDLNRQIRSAARNILESLENNVTETRNAEADLAKEINRLKAEKARVNKELVKLKSLQNKVDTERALLTEYRSRALEAKSRSGLVRTDAEIISEANLPSKAFFPKVIPFTIAGTVATTLLTVLLILAVNLLATVARSHKVVSTRHIREEPVVEEKPVPVQANEKAAEVAIDNESHTNTTVQNGADESSNEPDSVINRLKSILLPTLTSEEETPKIAIDVDAIKEDSRKKNRTSMIIAETAGSGNTTKKTPEAQKKPEMESAGVLSVRHAAHAIAERDSARLVIISPAGDAGSQTVWMLARYLAKANKSVVVIDMSGENTTSREMLGMENLPGFFNLLSGSISVDQAIFGDRSSNVHVVPSGELYDGAPLPDAWGVSNMVDAIAASYDFCLVDCGDADLGAVNVIAKDDSIAIISGVAASPQSCRDLQKELSNDGYQEVLQLVPRYD